MKRTFLAALVCALAVAVAAPAFALDFKLNGFLRQRAIWNNFGFGAATVFLDDAPDDGRIFEQRFRPKMTVTLNEYLSFVYFGEIDFDFGDSSLDNSRNQGGAIQGDTVNLETKNLYMDIKVPETPVGVRAGLQGFGDHFSGYFLASDVAGVTATAKLDMVDAKGGWFKLWEGSEIADDDVDLWTLQLGFQPTEGLDLGVDFYYANDNNPVQSSKPKDNLPQRNFGDGIDQAAGFQSRWGNSDLWWLGVHGAYTITPMDYTIDLSGWFLYNGGTLDSFEGSSTSVARRDRTGTGDVDVKGWAADLMASFSLMGAKISLEGLYVSGDDDPNDTDIEQPLSTALWSGSAGVLGAAGSDFPFYKSGLMILLYDPKGANFSSAALRDPQRGALGLWGVILQGRYVPATMEQVYVSGAVGWINSVEDADEFYGTGGESQLGVEFAGRIGYKLADFLDLSANGAYVTLGDFYDNWDAGDDPDDPWMGYIMAELAF